MAKGPTSLSESDLASYRCKHWVIVLPTGVSVEDALEPEFWAHVSRKLQPFHRIELQAEDRTFVAEAIVLSAGLSFAKLKLLEKYDLVENMEALEAEEATESPYKVKWNGPTEKWVVIRKSDGAKLKTGFEDKGAAENFALNHQRTVNA